MSPSTNRPHTHTHTLIAAAAAPILQVNGFDSCPLHLSPSLSPSPSLPPSLSFLLSYSNVCSLRLNLPPSSSPPYIPPLPSSSVPLHFFICFLHYLFHLLITPLQLSFLLPTPSLSPSVLPGVCVCVCARVACIDR